MDERPVWYGEIVSSLQKYITALLLYYVSRNGKVGLRLEDTNDWKTPLWYPVLDALQAREKERNKPFALVQWPSESGLMFVTSSKVTGGRLRN